MSLDYSLSVDEIPREWAPNPGDRVRVRISAECRVQSEPEAPASRDGYQIGHAPWEDGKLGTVVNPPFWWDATPMLAQGHLYMVLWDEPADLGNGERPVNASSYAITELEPLP